MSGDRVFDVYREVFNERFEQDERWGQQNHPDVWEGTYDGLQSARSHFAALSNKYKALNGDSYPVDWTGILLKEVYEALAESDRAKLRAELIQVAAVAVAWIEAIDRRG